MTRFRTRGAAVLAAAALALVAACESPAEVELAPAAVGDGLFDRYVALGNSITAGFQSSGINDSTQRESYARLVAQQMGTPYAYAALAGRGCPPPIVNFQTQARLGGAGVTATTCDLRTPASIAPFLNNVAVPNATVFDPTSASTSSSNALTTFILGGRTQVEAALAADPTFTSIWIGNNDVLAAAVTGVLAPLPGVSPGVTPVATFTAQYDALLTQLTTAAPELEGALVAVIDVRQAPILFPAAALLNPQFKAAFDQYAGTTTTVLPNCTPTGTALVSFAIVSQIRTWVATNGAAGHPPVISCAKGQFAPSPLVGELFVLDAQELTTLAQTVGAYNAHIAQRATDLGWAFYDPNVPFTALRQGGQIPPVPNLASATAPFGPYVSLDGVHPAGLAHRVLANGLIQAINATFATSIPLLP